MLDQVFRNKWGHNDSWNPWSKLIKEELMFLSSRSGRRRGSGSDVVVEAAMLVPENDENALSPNRRLADRFVGVLDELLARSDTSQRVLRISVTVVIRHII